MGRRRRRRGRRRVVKRTRDADKGIMDVCSVALNETTLHLTQSKHASKSTNHHIQKSEKARQSKPLQQVTSPSPTNLTLAYTRLRPNSASATYINGYQSSTTVHTLSITQLYNTPHPLPPYKTPLTMIHHVERIRRPGQNPSHNSPSAIYRICGSKCI